MEEQVSPVLLEREVAEFVDDELLVELIVGRGARKRTEERGCSDEQDRVGVLDSRAAGGDGEMTLADAGGPNSSTFSALATKRLANEPPVGRRLELEGEVVERLHHGDDD